MAQTFRTEKIKKFIAKQVEFMEMQQKVIIGMKQQGLPLEVLAPLEYNQTARYNYTFDLCREFNLEMPIVLGVTPQ